MNSLFLSYDPSLISQTTPQVQSQNIQDIIREELTTYKNMPLVFLQDDEILSWWTSQKSNLPLLYGLSRFIFSIPASSAAIEGNFSYAGLVTTDNRASLEPDNIEKILIIRNKWDLLNTAVGEF